jgi:hypothetical protein
VTRVFVLRFIPRFLLTLLSKSVHSSATAVQFKPSSVFVCRQAFFLAF